ncbi:MAG: bifunctional diaminohydroxyphosphoribosylaminopyrimidine deaminase/5-amino-6-(5-phosphoribosylamino)uracil reductase RibD [Phycisphaeraceae bacterium]|nr:bifunctional diaminohydroxyphosphoribosylaminopyrimidine deaminase/5-amino-6-(5-phosphoribosylamino)uracil reductase RibD [Phycisphaeraceae bacterium]
MPPQDFMTAALALARRGLGQVEPNPMVGAVLVRRGQIIGQGYHRRFGGPHAEVQALRDCRRRGHNPAGSDLYVTLEPCCHFGKTPPCTQAILDARIARVFAATVDPNPLVAGKGLRQLRRASVKIHVGLCQDQARELNAPFIKLITTSLPWVILKWAQTLDGRIATRAGDSRWISNESSRQIVHQLRARVDAVMVGINTVLADDPLLTARPRKGPRPRVGSLAEEGLVFRYARRVVIDPHLRLPERCRLLSSLKQNPQASPLTVAVHQDLLTKPSPRLKRLLAQGVEMIPLPPLRPRSARSALDLQPLLLHLAKVHQAGNVLCEGGATLFGQLLKQNLADELQVFLAPRLLGDDQALAAVRSFVVPKLQDARALQLQEVRTIAQDVYLRYRLAPARV